MKKKLNIFLGFVLAALLGITLFQRHGLQKYPVENLTGGSYQSVLEWMDRYSIPSDKVVFNYLFSDTVPENTVISQSLSENSYITSKNAMVVTVSKGSNPDQKIVLIDFTGMDQATITEWFAENEIENYEFISMINEDSEEGLFLASDPKAGTKISKDDQIRVAICEHDHSPTTPLPDFTGKTRDDIQEWADRYEISVNYIYYYNTLPEGTFIFSDIAAGTEVDKGGAISVAISSGSGQ